MQKSTSKEHLKSNDALCVLENSFGFDSTQRRNSAAVKET